MRPFRPTFHVLSFIQFCARKLLLPIVGLDLKFIFNYRVFSTKLYAHEMFGSRKLRTIFRVAPKSIWGLLPRAYARGVGVKPPLELDILQIFITFVKEIKCFPTLFAC